MMSSEPIYAIFGIILAENQKLEIRHYFVNLSINFGKEKYFESRKILFVLLRTTSNHHFWGIENIFCCFCIYVVGSHFIENEFLIVKVGYGHTFRPSCRL